MTFLEEALRDSPVALYMMDDTIPYQDYSGYNRVAQTNGGNGFATLALCSGAAYSQNFQQSTVAEFASPVFIQGKENQDFTLEVWARKRDISTATNQQILGNTGQFDGLIINQTTISFVLKYTDGTECRATYDMQKNQNAHIVGVKTLNGISLYVNGDLVASAEITPAQLLSTYTATNDKLYCGESANSGTIGINGVSLYSKALDAGTIKRHFITGSKRPDAGDLASAFQGTRIPLSIDQNTVFLNQWWDSKEKWLTGELKTVAVENDSLYPQFQLGTSVPGVWYGSFALDSAEVTSIYGVQMYWEGTGAAVEASVNGTTWGSVIKGRNISIIPNGYNPTDKTLQIRISFPGGVLNDPSYVKNFNVVGLLTTSTLQNESRTVTITPSASPEQEYPPHALHEDWGIMVDSTGSISISTDTSADALPARTVEIWVKPNSSGFPTTNITGTKYIMGVAQTGNPTSALWTVLHYVADADITTPITFSGASQIGQVVIYPTALTVTQINAIISRFNNSNLPQILDSSTITATEPGNSVKIYAHEWSIQGTS